MMNTDIPTVPTVPTAPAVEGVAPAVEGVAPAVSDDTAKSKRLSKTAKWEQIETEVKAILANEQLKAFPNVQSLIDKVIEFYKPKSGGGQDKDWSRRVETALGELVAKECYLTKLWYKVDDKNPKQSAMSKGKYVTKKLLQVIREAEEKAQTEAFSLMQQGQCITDSNKLTLINPNSKELDKFNAVTALYPDEVAKVAQDYSSEGLYLGASQSEAVQSLANMGISDTKISD